MDNAETEVEKTETLGEIMVLNQLRGSEAPIKLSNSGDRKHINKQEKNRTQ